MVWACEKRGGGGMLQMVEEMEGSQGEDQLEDQEEREKTQYGKIWLTWVLRREWH